MGSVGGVRFRRARRGCVGPVARRACAVVTGEAGAVLVPVSEVDGVLVDSDSGLALDLVDVVAVLGLPELVDVD